MDLIRFLFLNNRHLDAWFESLFKDVYTQQVLVEPTWSFGTMVCTTLSLSLCLITIVKLSVRIIHFAVYLLGECLRCKVT